MTVNVQFEDIRELETAFRAGVLFKFGGSSDADVFLGSPVMAEALKRMLNAIEEYWLTSGSSKRAESWRDLYLVSKVKRHADLITAHAVRHPKWSSMARQEQLDWLQVVAAPYRLDDAGVAFFEEVLAK